MRIRGAALAARALVAGLVWSLCGCAGDPPAPEIDGPPLDLIAQLGKRGDRYVVSSYCTRRAAPESQYRKCWPDTDAILFDAFTKVPLDTSEHVECPTERSSRWPLFSIRCGDLRDLYSTNFLRNLRAASSGPGCTRRMIDCVRDAGETSRTWRSLDTRAFRRAAEEALPPEQLRAVVQSERQYRADYPQRQAQAAAEKNKALANQRAAEDEKKMRRAAAAERARQRFLAAASVPKKIGGNVCSADNRLAQVEQISGSRINVSVRGRALGHAFQAGDGGPFNLDPNWGRGINLEDIVLDRYFLFQGIFKLNFLRIDQRLWAESSEWGECGYAVG